jgi:hypothetical protein
MQLHAHARTGTHIHLHTHTYTPAYTHICTHVRCVVTLHVLPVDDPPRLSATELQVGDDTGSGYPVRLAVTDVDTNVSSLEYWLDVLPPKGVLYVRAPMATGGSGSASERSPFVALSASVSSSSADVALGPLANDGLVQVTTAPYLLPSSDLKFYPVGAGDGACLV